MAFPIDVYPADEVKLIEKAYASEHNSDCYDLMLKAGKSVYEAIAEYAPSAKDVWIFCGKGNNGGDGYVLAKMLLESGVSHRVFAIDNPHPQTEAEIAFENYIKAGGHIEYDLPNKGLLPNDGIVEYTAPSVIVDALLGTGIESAPAGVYAKWIMYINQLHSYVFSVDIPSGVVADTGYVPGACIRADITVCMLALKPGLLTGDAVDYTGKILFSSLGVNTQDYASVIDKDLTKYSLPIQNISYEGVKCNLPVRYKSFNKGDSGKVLIIAGAKGMGGAAIICASAALRAGAGLAKVALDDTNISPMLANRPELMSVDLNNEEELVRAIKWADVIAVGPGLGVNERTYKILDYISNLEDTPVIYDADALNVLSTFEQNYYNENRVITPHLGEAARLLGCSIDDLSQDRLAGAYKLWQKYGGVVLLKGAGTIICDGQSFSIIREGSPALATGGSGDLLTGIIVSLLGQGLSLKDASVTAACIHGKAATVYAREHGIIGTLPMDLLSNIQGLINYFK